MYQRDIPVPFIKDVNFPGLVRVCLSFPTPRNAMIADLVAGLVEGRDVGQLDSWFLSRHALECVGVTGLPVFPSDEADGADDAPVFSAWGVWAFYLGGLLPAHFAAEHDETSTYLYLAPSAKRYRDYSWWRTFNVVTGKGARNAVLDFHCAGWRWETYP